MSDERRLVIDFIACDGQGFCADLLPQNVELDDWGYPIITDGAIPADRLRAAKRAIRACPELAMRLEEMRAKQSA